MTPYHGYWGGTRDRILISEDELLENEAGPELREPKSPPAGLGEIIDVVMPHNAVCTRGGPDWSDCAPDELHEFANSVYPAYVAGGRYLSGESEDSGCYGAYLVQETDADGNDVKRNHQIAFFVQLSDLEKWTKSHPTHKAIFGRFMQMLQKIGRMPDMNLYHEVSVIPRGGLKATYVNCLPTTSLLRFGTVREG